MWVVKVKHLKGSRKVYRKVWRLSPKERQTLWEFACYVILAIMLMAVIWYE